MLYARTEIPYTGVAESGVTSKSLFLGDACGMTWSLTTNSNTASTWTLQCNNGDGFTASLAEADWFTSANVSAQGLYSIDSGGALSGLPRWARFLRTPSNSSSTIRVSYCVRD